MHRKQPNRKWIGPVVGAVVIVLIVTGGFIIRARELDKKDKTNEKAYIDKEEAKDIAYDHANADNGKVKLEEIEFGTDNGIMLYEVDFKEGSIDHENDINAVTGEVIASTNYIGKSKAKAIALDHAGVSEAALIEYEAELDQDDYRTVYDIEFETNEAEYDYELDALTGEIIESESRQTQKANKNDTSPIPTKPPVIYLSEDRIKEIVFQHAGVDAANVYELEIELDGIDDDDDRAVYEVDFKVGRTEYDYDVDAITGNIIKSKVEPAD